MASTTGPLASQVCPTCGMKLPLESGSAGLCPRCLMDTVVTDLTALDHPALTVGGTRRGSPDLAELAEQLPQFEFQELLGGGNTGWVYRARQKSLDRGVAIKLLPSLPADPMAATGRFQQEAQILARLNHARIVTVFDYGIAGDARYLVMELVPGPTLRDVISAGPLAPDDCIRVIDEICEAIEFAHSKGVTHRDLKPENVLLESDDPASHIKVADFGISRLLGEVERPMVSTRTSLVLGTPYYVAPEQMKAGAAVDHRVDIFAIGVMLYELLTRQLPMGRFAPPSRLSKVRPSMDDVVLRCLESDPDRRFPDVASLRRALAAARKSPTGTHRKIGWLAAGAIVLALAAWGVKAALTDRPRDIAQARRLIETAADTSSKQATAEPAQTEAADADGSSFGSGHPPLAQRSDEGTAKKDKRSAPQKPAPEGDILISSIKASGRYPHDMEFRMECHLENPDMSLTKGSKLVYVVETQLGRRLTAPLAFPEGRRDITVRNNVTIGPMDRWPVEIYVEEQWQEPTPGSRRVSNIFRLEWYEVPMTTGF
jgi:hypothetical protein